MMRDFRRLMAVSATLAMSVSAMAASPVSAHSADSGGSCVGDIKIVFWDLTNFTGTNDDFCFTAPVINGYQIDPNLSANNTMTDVRPADDVGNNNAMNNIISSFSIDNQSSHTMCMTLYEDTQYGTFMRQWWVANGQHLHVTLGITYANRAESLKVSTDILDDFCQNP
jgi:hypothetical protein